LGSQLEHFSFIGSLLISEFLVLLIFERKFLVFLLFLVVLKFKLQSGLLLKSTDQLRVYNNIGDVTLLKHDTILLELAVQLSHHSVSHIRLQIENLRQPNAVDKCSHVFFNFSGQKLIESSSTKLVHKVLYELSILRHSEGEMNIDINVSVILSWASLDWSVIVDDVLGEHASNSLVEAIAPLGTWGHHTSGFTTFLFENSKVGWDIKLDIETAALVRDFNHGQNSLLVRISGSCHLVLGISA
jgi:hypothetical protein